MKGPGLVIAIGKEKPNPLKDALSKKGASSKEDEAEESEEMDDDSESPSEEELAAYKLFKKATSDEEGAMALKEFVKACGY